MQDFFSCEKEKLKVFLNKWQEPSFRLGQIWDWVYKKEVSDFQLMHNLPRQLVERLAQEFHFNSLQIRETFVSCDGTKKFIFSCQEGGFIESVLIPQGKRLTACLSTQVGCRFGCAFCASGLKGFRRNLSSGEIIAQLFWLNKDSAKKITHLVFMGIGEPLDNYDSCLKAIRLFNSSDAFGIGARRITISTCGIITGIKKLAEENLQIELSISLHAADERLRSQLMPVNKIYPLKDLLFACQEYIQKTNRQITFEYVLIKGINSDLSCAKKLVKIAKSLKLCKVNLIQANEVRELKIFPPDKKTTNQFKDFLLDSAIAVTLRQPRGQDIQAACGQLRLQYEKEKE